MTIKQKLFEAFEEKILKTSIVMCDGEYIIKKENQHGECWRSDESFGRDSVQVMYDVDYITV